MTEPEDHRGERLFAAFLCLASTIWMLWVLFMTVRFLKGTL
jgi:hypothetical protein